MIFRDLEGNFQFAAEFFAVGEVELVFLDEELAVHLVGGVFDEEFVFVARKDDADGRTQRHTGRAASRRGWR